VYVFLVPQPLALHNHRPLRAGTSKASTRPLTPAHTLPHGRLQRTEGPSSMDHGFRFQSLTPPLLPFAQAAASATSGLQPTWDSPATLLDDLVGAWLGTRVQRKRDRQRTLNGSQLPASGRISSDLPAERQDQQESSAPWPLRRQLSGFQCASGSQNCQNSLQAELCNTSTSHRRTTVSIVDTPGNPMTQTPGLGPGGGAGGARRTHNPSPELTVRMTSSPRWQQVCTPSMASDQTPGLGPGGGDDRLCGARPTQQLLTTRQGLQRSYRSSISADNLYLSLREQCLDTPTWAVTQTPGLGPGGGASDQGMTTHVVFSDAHILGLDTLATAAPQAHLETATTVEPTPTSCSTLSATAPGHARPPDVSHA
jgi:hypothetical protein